MKILVTAAVAASLLIGFPASSSAQAAKGVSVTVVPFEAIGEVKKSVAQVVSSELESQVSVAVQKTVSTGSLNADAFIQSCGEEVCEKKTTHRVRGSIGNLGTKYIVRARLEMTDGSRLLYDGKREIPQNDDELGTAVSDLARDIVECLQGKNCKDEPGEGFSSPAKPASASTQAGQGAQSTPESNASTTSGRSGPITCNTADECHRLGDDYFLGRNVGRSVRTAKQMFQSGCELNDAYSCHSFGENIEAAKAVTFFTKACNLGFWKSCSALASYFHETVKDRKKAREWGPKALNLLHAKCSESEASACYELNHLFSTGSQAIGVQKNGSKAIEYYGLAFSLAREQCNEAIGEACGIAGLYYTTADKYGGISDENASVSYFVAGCDLFDISSCANLALSWSMSGSLSRNIVFPKPPESLTYLLDRSCVFNSQSCNFAGEIYKTGIFISPNYDKAYAVYVEGCNKLDPYSCKDAAKLILDGKLKGEKAGDAIPLLDHICYDKINIDTRFGCALLGIAYLRSGDEIPRREEFAKKALDYACLANIDDLECIDAALILMEGTSVQPDTNRAVRYLKNICPRDNIDICRLIAFQYLNGEHGRVKNPGLAREMFSAICEVKDTISCKTASNMYRLSPGYDGLQADEKLSVHYARRACDLGVIDYCGR